MNFLEQWVLSTGTYVDVDKLVTREQQVELEAAAARMSNSDISMLVWKLAHTPLDSKATAAEANLRTAWLEILRIELSDRD